MENCPQIPVPMGLKVAPCHSDEDAGISSYSENGSRARSQSLSVFSSRTTARTADSTSALTSNVFPMKQYFRRPDSNPAFLLLLKMKQTLDAGASYRTEFHEMLSAFPTKRTMLPFLGM